MIYAQRPDATACASMELWNETMRRWVKPRSKGIALIRKDKRGKPQLEYVFDVADTRPVRGAKTPYLWEMTAEKSGAVAEMLEQQYGPCGETDIGWQLMEQAKRAADGAYQDYLEDLRYDARDSLLEELDDLNLEVRFRKLLTASVQYTILTRCGLDPGEYLEDEDLFPTVEEQIENIAQAQAEESKGPKESPSPARERSKCPMTKTPEVSKGELSAAARALAQKMQPDITEGKLSLMI